MNKIAAIVVTHNRKEKLFSCVQAVMKQSASVKPDIIVVDNNSNDGTNVAFNGPEALFADDRIHYFNTGCNTGGAGGFCFGIRKAVLLGYDYVWLMDDDCAPSENALEVFLDFDRRHRGKYGFLSSKVLWRDGSICNMNVQREKLTKNVTNWDRDEIEIKMASFVSLFIPVDIVMEAGLPFRQFFIWTDDWEYTRRISLKHKCYLLTGSTALHDTEYNSGADIASADGKKLDRFRYLYRNDVYLYRREGLAGLTYEAVRLTVHAIRVMVSDKTFGDKIHRIGIIINGTLDGLKFYPMPDRAAKPERTE